LPSAQYSYLWLDLIIGSAKRKERRRNREGSPKACFGVIPEKKDKLAVFKKAITGATYKVKAEDIAEKIFKEWLFELALTLHNHKYQKCWNNESISRPGNIAIKLSLTSGQKEEQLAEMKSLGTFSGGTSKASNGPKIKTNQNLLERDMHLHSHEIISGRLLRPRSTIHAHILGRFARGLFLGISIIGVFRFQWWR